MSRRLKGAREQLVSSPPRVKNCIGKCIVNLFNPCTIDGDVSNKVSCVSSEAAEVQRALPAAEDAAVVIKTDRSPAPELLQRQR